MRGSSITLTQEAADAAMRLIREEIYLRDHYRTDYGSTHPDLCPDCWQPEYECDHDLCDSYWEREDILRRLREIEDIKKKNLEAACPIHIICRK